MDPKQFNPTQLNPPAKLIVKGQVVAFPTETVYGLGANAFDANAVKKIFEAKQRPADNPLIVHVSSIEMLKECVVEIPDNVKSLIEHFWPGPLTILFQRSAKIPNEVTAGLPTVAIRMPSHPIAKALIEIAGVPIAAPSANASGRPSPTTANHVINDLSGRIPMIIDGGPSQVGVESTVIDVFRNPPMILRPGGVTLEQLREFIPNIVVYDETVSKEDLTIHPPTPGMKYRHYAPKAQTTLYEGSSELIGPKIIAFIQEKLNANAKVGLIHTRSSIIYPASMHGNRNFKYYPLGSEAHPEIIARGLFKAFRDLDEDKVDFIIMEGIEETAEGLAVMNRARKAASTVIHL